MRWFRKERVASVVRSIVSEALVHRMSDPRIATLTTVTRVEMTGDLTIAKVYLTVPGGDVDERKTMAAIRHAAGYLQRMVAGELSLRTCPVLHFEIDTAAKTAMKTLALLEENRRKNPDLAAPGEEAGPHMDKDGDDEAGDDSSSKPIEGV